MEDRKDRENGEKSMRLKIPKWGMGYRRAN